MSETIPESNSVPELQEEVDQIAATPRNLWKVLRMRRLYKWTLLSAVASFLGDAFNLVTLLALIDRFPNSGVFAISLVFMVQFLPGLVMIPFSGPIADRFDRGKVMTAMDMLRVPIVLGLTLVTPEANNLWLMYVLYGMQMMAGVVFEPSAEALTPDVVGADEVLVATTAFAWAWGGLMFLGAWLGGVVVSASGSEHVGFYVDAATYLVSAACTMQLWGASSGRSTGKGQQQQQQQHVDSVGLDDVEMQPLMRQTLTPVTLPDVSTEPQPGILEMAVVGYRFMRQNPHVVGYVLCKGLVNLCLGVPEVISIDMAERLYPDSSLSQSTRLGLLYAAMGLATLTLPLYSYLQGDKQDVRTLQQATSRGFWLQALGTMLMLLAPYGFPCLIISCYVRHFGGSIVWTLSTSLWTPITPSQVRGRVSSWEMALGLIFAVLAYCITGAADLLHLSSGPVEVYGTVILTFAVAAAWHVWMRATQDKLATAAAAAAAVTASAGATAGAKPNQASIDAPVALAAA